MSSGLDISYKNGSHSFYGIMKIYVNSGNFIINGAQKVMGQSFTASAPIYSLPITLESESAFSINISPISQDNLHPSEIPYYFPSNIPEGFTSYFPGVMYSPIFHGPSFPKSACFYLDSILKYPPSKTFIAGNKGAGKSTFTRFFVNKVISKYGKVGLIDIDPGQPEVSIPGSISFAILDDYLLHPPERNITPDAISYFYGSNSVSDNLPLYLECVSSIMEHVPSDLYCIVNSFGWVNDLGLKVHQDLMQVIKPENMIFLAKANDTIAPIRERMFVVNIESRPGAQSIKPKQQRDIRVLSLFNKYLRPLSCIHPQFISFSDVRIGIMYSEVHPTEYLTALNGSLVALCFDDRNYPQSKKLITIIKSITSIRAIGFGIVKAIDKQTHQFALITNLNLAENKINTILMGSVCPPIEVYKDSPRNEANFLDIVLSMKSPLMKDPLALKNPTILD